MRGRARTCRRLSQNRSVDPIGTVLALVQSVFAWFQGLVPGGFGLILIPLAIIGGIAVLVSIRR